MNIVLFLFGTLGYIIIDDFSLIDAIYQTGITYTTVGFGEMSPISPAGRFFTITLIIFGFMIFTLSIGILIDVLNKGELIKLIKELFMLKDIEKLRNHVIICYQNDYTITLAKYFAENNIPFVVIGSHPDLYDIAKKHNYRYFIHEAPHTDAAFLKASLMNARGVITLSPLEADNIAVISSVKLFEKEYNKEFNIMSFINNEDNEEKLKKLGASVVVSPARLLAERFLTLSVRPDMKNILEEFLYRKDSPLDIEEVIVPSNSWIRLKQIKDTHLRDVNVSIIAIVEENGKLITMPKGDTLIKENARLLLLGKSKDILKAKNVIYSSTNENDDNEI